MDDALCTSTVVEMMIIYNTKKKLVVLVNIPQEGGSKRVNVKLY